MKIVWFLLTTTTTIVVMLCGGWAFAQTKEMDNIRARISAVEQANAEVNAKLDILLAHWGLKYTIPARVPKDNTSISKGTK